MTTFEDKIRESARRSAESENSTLHTPVCPTVGRRTYWGWVATPAAAVVGVLMGMFIPLLSGGKDDAALVARTDTVRVVEHVRDTLYLTQTVEKEKVVEKVVWRERRPAETLTAKQPVEDTLPECSSIRCDGINYAMLFSN